MSAPVNRPSARCGSCLRCYFFCFAPNTQPRNRRVSDLSLDAWHCDLDAVAASTEDPRLFPLDLSQGGALAVACTLMYPERVPHLVLLNAYYQGAQTEADWL